MATYYHRHPRGFANECDITRCDTPEQATAAEVAGYERITREEARRHIRWVNGENATWGSGRAFGDISFAALTDSNHPEYAEYSYQEAPRHD